MTRIMRVLGLAAACVGILTTTACQVPFPASPSTSQGSTVITSEFSTLDASGVDRIRTDKRAKLDMSGGTLQKSAVRVTDDSYGPEINTQNSGKIELTIVGPSGEIHAQTDRIRFKTTDARPDFTEVTYFLTADSAEDFAALIRDGVEKYGIDADDAERWISSTSKDSSAKSDYSLTSGTSTGLEVNYDLRFDGSKETQVIIVHVTPVS
ncbi:MULTISPECIES: hypothetical protein [Paenarthrobacter]|uniref:hypothetical protein n=1 Tax=Paenarthrobacter TaxID=1742992 RepID=UPI0023650D50|nr:MULTISPECIES: hypothetical protein [Paenarthrobacter]MDD7836341.1 hypothetical protein [Paenarthrobacter sp. AB444]MDP9937448.1 hypothetical protein [Paenarthrobacter nicotinovorans]